MFGKLPANNPAVSKWSVCLAVQETFAHKAFQATAVSLLVRNKLSYLASCHAGAWLLIALPCALLQELLPILYVARIMVGTFCMDGNLTNRINACLAPLYVCSNWMQENGQQCVCIVSCCFAGCASVCVCAYVLVCACVLCVPCVFTCLCVGVLVFLCP